MSAAVVNGSTVRKFVDDEEAFERCVKECFAMVDIDGDGVVSRDDFRGGLNRVVVLECVADHQVEAINDTIFESFDKDRNGCIDRDEFRSFMKEIMLAYARAFGNSLVLVAICEHSLLTKAVQYEFHNRSS